MKQYLNNLKQHYKTYYQKLKERPWLLRAIIGIIVLILIWSAYNWYVQKRIGVMMSLVRPVPVMAVNVEQRSMPVMVRAFGDLRAFSYANLSAETAGDIVDISFNGGEKVDKGTLLVTIDNEMQKANLMKAQANKDLKQIEYERTVNLVQRGAQTLQMLDIAKAELEVSKAELLNAQDALNKTMISAPFNGRLGARIVSIGQYISPGQSIVEIVNLDKLKVQYAVPEKYLSQLNVGQDVQITTLAYPGREFKGVVDYVAPNIDTVTRNISVEALVKNEEDLLSPGLSVQASQVLAQDNNALVLPEESLVYSLEGPSVFIAEDDPEFKLDERVEEGIREQQAAQRGIPVEELPPLKIKKVRKARVETGTFLNGLVQITQGVKAGDLIVTQGQQKLRDGAIVMIVDPAARLAEAEAKEKAQAK